MEYEGGGETYDKTPRIEQVEETYNMGKPPPSLKHVNEKKSVYYINMRTVNRVVYYFIYTISGAGHSGGFFLYIII